MNTKTYDWDNYETLTIYKEEHEKTEEQMTNEYLYKTVVDLEIRIKEVEEFIERSKIEKIKQIEVLKKLITKLDKIADRRKEPVVEPVITSQDSI